MSGNELAPLRRLAGCALAWLLLFLASPGLFRPLGFGHVAFVALVPWALTASRPGKYARRIEWTAAAVGLAVFSYWLNPVVAFVIPLIGIVTALYVVLAGMVLRALARRFPLALATPLAWLAGEMPRFLLQAPLSFGWWRLGTMAHYTEWLVGSARVWGVFGLTWVFAAFGGMLADLIVRGRAPLAGRRPLGPIVAWGLAPLGIAMALCLITSPPPMTDGPRVLLVQPGLEQKRKSFPEEPLREILGDACALTLEGLDDLRARGEPLPDLVAWGETMLWIPVVEDGFAEAVERGARPLAWTGDRMEPGAAKALALQERVFVHGLLFGDTAALAPLAPGAREQLASSGLGRVLAGERLVPEGTSFFSGAEYYCIRDGAVRRQNAAFLWDAEGHRSGPAAKVHLVPGAESMRGTQHLPFFLDVMREVGGYVPDFVPAERAAVLELGTRSGERYRVGVSICYDGAFDDPYTEPLQEGELDFHLLASNEAWYEDSIEMDYMVAFAKTMAVATARSFVRATNSGITTVIDAHGREVATLAVGGRRKMVRGTLLARVPVPERGAAAASPTFFVRTAAWQPAFWSAAVLLALLLSRPRSVTSPGAPASAPTARPAPAGRA